MENNMPVRASIGETGSNGTQPPHYSQTTTTIPVDIMRTTTLVPSDIFLVDDTIKVVGNSKHRGRMATVRKVGSGRLTVWFHDNNIGTYVDFADARIIDNPTPEAEEITGLTSVMEQLAITAATAIKTGEPSQQRQALLHDFVLSLQGHIENIPREDDVR
jgi:hypothetical protein